ncbi:MAG: histidine ammonia-lyase [Candidatus Hodarchaeota archaeon]
MGQTAVVIDNKLSFTDFLKVVRGYTEIKLSPLAKNRINRCRLLIEQAIESGEIIYGVNTGFGELSRVRIDTEDIEQLQRNLIRSHAAGVGDPLPEEVVRGAILLLINSLAKGHSGVRKIVVEQLISFLNAKITPIVPSIGSLGASGDLAPLAHIALVLLGEGEAKYNNQRVSGKEALKQANLEPIKLAAREGLACINGTHVMLSSGLLMLIDSIRALNHAIIATALSTEALHGTNAAFEPQIHKLRPHPGQIQIASCLFELMQGSEILESHRVGDDRVQDCYSFRCSPQVLGASLDTLRYVREVLMIEMNAITDNPLVLENGTVQSAGHFHGQPLALAYDFLSIALAEVGSISERRIDRLLNPVLGKFPPFLSKKPGLNSGLMIAQYTAAALVSQNKTYATPSSVDSIPVSANKEDHVSMGMNAALKVGKILDNLEHIIAIELLCAAQGLEFSAPLKTSAPLQAVIKQIRNRVPPLIKDRVLYPDILVIKKLIQQYLLVDTVTPYVSLISMDGS